MNKNDKLIIIVGVAILVVASFGIYLWVPPGEGEEITGEIYDFYDVYGVMSDTPDSVTVSMDCPFYSLIATPLTIYYDQECEQHKIPLYIENFNDPSSAVTRAREMIGKSIDFQIGCDYDKTIKEISLEIAETFWEESNGVLLIEYSSEGYNLGAAATPIASYLSIPVIVTDVVDSDVQEVLEKLGVTKSIICGDLDGIGEKPLRFKNIDDVLDATIEIVNEKFGDVEYITLSNPLDITDPVVVEEKTYDFEGTVSSMSFTPSHMVNLLVGSITGSAPMLKYHSFDVPDDYKYARITIDLVSLVDEDVEETGSMLQGTLYDPDGTNLAFVFTMGGIPVRNSDGGIETDRITWDTIMYDKPGEYTISVAGKILTHKTGDYEIHVKVEKLNSSIVPNMKGLSSIAPYLTAFRKGVNYANPDFVWVADESIIPDPNPGVVYPASNPDLIEESNKHVFKMHESLNTILASLKDINLDDEDGLERLKEVYDKDPMYIALVGDALMIPQYYYYDTEDANSIRFGWDVASDFIYGNIDPIPRDEFFTDYDEKYPHMENIVGRITGWDAQDASALVARTAFYDDILENMENEDWQKTAIVQTGSGTDFQRIPGFDLLRKILGAHDLPFKWPTGEAHFENLIIQSSIEPGGFDIRSTENTESMRKGISDEVLKEVNRLGFLNLLFFPKTRASLVFSESSRNAPTGAIDQEESNYIFTFAHGQPMGFGHGDIQVNSIGISLAGGVLLDNIFNRVITFGTAIPAFTSGLGNMGNYPVRYVENMQLGPSVMFVESCYIGRIDGFPAKCLSSQSYLHAGVNAFIASSRGTPGPGYLDARKYAKGFGLSEFIKTVINPSLQKPHFSALHASNIFSDLTENNVDIGTAFRNAKNKFMDDADSEFFWTPPLSLDIQTYDDLDLLLNNIKSTSGGDAKCMEKKYTCMFEFNLFADPAFNPYEPDNRG